MKSIRLSLLITTIIFSQCSILKNEDPEKDVRAFLTTFQNNLTKSDDEIVSLFRVQQSRDAILTVINVLQNKDPFIVCDTDFANAKITFEKEHTRVEIPVTFSVKNLNAEDTISLFLTFELESVNKSYVISQLEGETFYEQFAQIKNAHSWEAEAKLAMQQREPIYAIAQQLEPQFDSVIWYTQYQNQTYFYVVQGAWTNFFLNSSEETPSTDAKMGLVDASGNVVIPSEYDRIGALGFDYPNVVEVMQNGKVGYFDIAQKKLLAEPVYDLIIPYPVEQITSLVRQDGVYGWLDQDYRFTVGFPTDRAEKWVTEFLFLQQPFSLKPDSYAFCEIPNAEYAGNGIIISPVYLSQYKIFNEIESGISTTKTPIHGWTEYKETTGWFFQLVSDKVQALVTTVKQRYIEGREEFYTSNQILFVDSDHRQLGSGNISGDQITVRSIDSTMLEVVTPHDYWFMEYDIAGESNLYEHHYFSISEEGTVSELKSDRMFPETEFVKLDSSYLSGVFEVYLQGQDRPEQRYFLSTRTITYMRDEILAMNGFTFTEPEKEEKFKQLFQDKYQPRYHSIEEFDDQLSEIDRHNLDFLNGVLQTLNETEEENSKVKV